MAIVSFDMSRFPFSFFFYLLLKCKTFFKPLFKLNYTGVNLLYQSPEAGGGGGIYGLKEHLLSFSILKLIFLKKIRVEWFLKISFWSLI